MKQLLYRLFALCFNLSRLLPVKDNRVAFVSMHNEGFNDSLGGMKKLLDAHEEFEKISITRKDLSLEGKSAASAVRDAAGFFLVKARLLATAKYVFLNDNFMPMGFLRFSRTAVLTQLWHAEGVFKRFGLACSQPDKIRKQEIAGNRRLTWVVCSSKGVAPYYAEAFGVDESKVLPLGSARTDLLFCRDDIDTLKREFTLKHPETSGKKLVLYAPTFRDDPEADAHLTDSLNIELFNSVLGTEYALLIRLHPQLHADKRDFTGAVDLTDHNNPVELVLLSDILITDYSSICMDFALLGKPVLFYAFDLDQYKNSRNFYFDYESYVPGRVLKSFPQLIDTLRDGDFSGGNKCFRDFNFDAFDGRAAQRIAERIMGLKP